MSEINSPAKATAGFNRRAIVKGAAWSVPVIAVAMAAPAAAASPPTGTVCVVLGPSAKVVCRGEESKNGTGPTTLTITNTTAATITGTATFKVTITRAANTPGIRVSQFGGTAVNMGKYASNAVTASFSRQYTVAAGAVQTFAVGYSQDASGHSYSAGKYGMTVATSLTSPLLADTATRTLTLLTTDRH